MADKIIVLDFGSQYNQLIARRIREFGVYSELHPNTMTLAEIQALGEVKGIIFSGGPNSVYDENAFKCDPAIFTSGLPILGICYGMQMTHFMNGGDVRSCDSKEYGRTEIEIETDSLLFKGCLLYTSKQQAESIGKPKALRAIGMANHRNPIPIFIPCHRVIGADGSLTGYGGGLQIKRTLLDLERRTLEKQRETELQKAAQ